MAASSGAIRAGRAFVEVFIQDSVSKGLAQISAKLKAAGAGIKAFGAGMLKAGVVASTPFAASLKIFSDFADTMAQVRAVTSANEKDFGRLNDKAKELGATTSFTASQVAEGMKYLGMAGFNTEQILAGIPAVLNLARAGAIDLGMAADIASDVGSAFGLAADDIGHIADVMAVTASSANTNIEMMGETLKYAAPLAAAAGQSLEDTATAIGVLGNSGIKASMAGTDLALIFKLMGGDAKDALKSIGVESVDAQGTLRSVVDVMKDLGAATANMTEEDKLAFFSKNFDRAAKSALILSKGGKSLDELGAKIANADGAAERMAKMMDDNVGGAFRGLMSAVEGVAIAIGEALSPSIRAVAGWLTTVSGSIKQFVTENQTLIQTVAAVAAGLVLGGGVLVGLGAAMTAAGAAVGGLATALSAVATVVGVVVSPFGLAVAAIGGLVYYSGIGSKALAALKAAFGDTFAAASSTIGQIGQAIAAGDLQGAFAAAVEGLQLIWAELTTSLTLMWIDFKERFIGYAPDFLSAMTAVWDGLKAGWEWVSGVVSSVWQATVDFLQSTVGGLVDSMGLQIGSLSDLWYGFQEAAVLVWSGLQSTWANFVAGLTVVWENFVTGVVGLWEVFKLGFLKSIGNVVTALRSLGVVSSEVFGEWVDQAAELGGKEDEKRTSDAIKARIAAQREAMDKAAQEQANTIAEIEQQRNAQFAAIDEKRQAGRREGTEVYQQQRDAAQAKLQAARDKVAQAAANRQLPKAYEPVKDDLAAIADKIKALSTGAVDQRQTALADARAGVAAADSKFTSQGTFNGAALLGLQAAGASDRLTQLSEKQLAVQKQIATNTEQGGTF